MSIANEIIRLKEAKANLKSSIESKGVIVPDDLTIDKYPELIDNISGGGELNNTNLTYDFLYDYDPIVVNNVGKVAVSADVEVPDYVSNDTNKAWFHPTVIDNTARIASGHTSAYSNEFVVNGTGYPDNTTWESIGIQNGDKVWLGVSINDFRYITGVDTKTLNAFCYYTGISGLPYTSSTNYPFIITDYLYWTSSVGTPSRNFPSNVYSPGKRLFSTRTDETLNYSYLTTLYINSGIEAYSSSSSKYITGYFSSVHFGKNPNIVIKQDCKKIYTPEIYFWSETPPTIESTSFAPNYNASWLKATVYYPKGADYSSIIEMLGTDKFTYKDILW